MSQDDSTILFPIPLSKSTPEALERLLIDYGIPVIRLGLESTEFEIVDTETRLAGRFRLGIGDRADLDFSDRFRIDHVISWQSLLPESVSIRAIDDELSRSSRWSWMETDVRISESIIRTPIADLIVENLRKAAESFELPWIRLAPWPAGFDGVFNFRFDLDELAIEDWLQIIRRVRQKGIESGTTWFLSTLAARKCPSSIELLEGLDVQSHGHWHHVHEIDPWLNAANIEIADRSLHAWDFAPEGFASPAGRIVPDLAPRLIQQEYRYLAGLSDVSGSIPRTDRLGLKHIHALPVCEGAFLEAGIDSIDRVVSGYLAIADRAVRHDHPIFWFGHPDRRLGRKPAILDRLFDAVSGFGRMWHITLGQYANWIDDRNQFEVRAGRLSRDSSELTISWKSRRISEPPPALWIERNGQRWSIACEGKSGGCTTDFGIDRSQPMPYRDAVPEIWPAEISKSWKSSVRNMLDWERESPVEFLRGGPPLRRIKGLLRRATDRSWRERFEPLAWSREDSESEKAA
jgi:hypothetical protein